MEGRTMKKETAESAKSAEKDESLRSLRSLRLISCLSSTLEACASTLGENRLAKMSTGVYSLRAVHEVYGRDTARSVQE